MPKNKKRAGLRYQIVRITVIAVFKDETDSCPAPKLLKPSLLSLRYPVRSRIFAFFGSVKRAHPLIHSPRLGGGSYLERQRSRRKQTGKSKSVEKNPSPLTGGGDSGEGFEDHFKAIGRSGGEEAQRKK